MTKTQGFRQDLHGFVFIPVEWYDKKLKGILKYPIDFYLNHHDYPITWLLVKLV